MSEDDQQIVLSDVQWAPDYPERENRSPGTHHLRCLRTAMSYKSCQVSQEEISVYTGDAYRLCQLRSDFHSLGMRYSPHDLLLSGSGLLGFHSRWVVDQPLDATLDLLADSLSDGTPAIVGDQEEMELAVGIDRPRGLLLILARPEDSHPDESGDNDRRPEYLDWKVPSEGWHGITLNEIGYARNPVFLLGTRGDAPDEREAISGSLEIAVKLWTRGDVEIPEGFALWEHGRGVPGQRCAVGLRAYDAMVDLLARLQGAYPDIVGAAWVANEVWMNHLFETRIAAATMMERWSKSLNGQVREELGSASEFLRNQFSPSTRRKIRDLVLVPPPGSPVEPWDQDNPEHQDKGYWNHLLEITEETLSDDSRLSQIESFLRDCQSAEQNASAAVRRALASFSTEG